MTQKYNMTKNSIMSKCSKNWIDTKKCAKNFEKGILRQTSLITAVYVKI